MSQQQLQLSTPAEDLARELVDDYGRALLLEAKQTAYKGRYAAITPDHTAADEEINRRRRHSSGSELGILIGGACIGAGVQGFITELGTGRLLWLTVYVIVGVAGLLLGFFALTR